MRLTKIYLLVVGLCLFVPHISQADNSTSTITTSNSDTSNYATLVKNCTSESGYINDDCIENYIIAKKADISLCNYAFPTSELYNHSLNIMTRDECYNTVIEKTKPDYKCEELKNAHRQAWCYEKKCQTPACCNKINSYAYVRDRASCISRIAITTKNLDLCAKSGDAYCIEALSETHVGPLPDNICINIPYEKERAKCINFVAVKNKNQNTCYAFKNDSKEFSHCIRLLLDEKKCKLIKNGLEKDQCYGYVSDKQKNYKLCNKINTGWLKHRCRAEEYNYINNGYNTGIGEIIVHLLFMIALYILYLVIRKKDKLLFLMPATTISIFIIFFYRIIPDSLYLVFRLTSQTVSNLEEGIMNFGLRAGDIILLSSEYSFATFFPYKWMSIILVNLLGFLFMIILSYILKNRLSNKKIMVLLISLWILLHLLMSVFLMMAFALAMAG